MGRGPQTPRWVGWAVIASLYLVLVVLWAVNPAMPWQERIESFQASYVVNPDGSLEVTETLRWHFGWGIHHGIQRKINTEQVYGSARDQTREYEMDQVKVSSPTGAPADVEVLPVDGGKNIRIGDPVDRVEGDQTYVISYRLQHTVNRIKEPTDHVELYWNVTGLDTSIPTDQVSVSVRGPSAVSRAECFQGIYGSRDQCSAQAGEQATFEADELGPKEGMTLVAGFDPARFTDTSPKLVPRSDSAPPPPETTVSKPRMVAKVLGWTGVGVPLVAVAMMGLVAVRGARDAHFVGVTPGLTPRKDARTRSGKAAGEVAVQFQPPEGLQPGLARVLLEEKIDGQAVSATLIDLAIRGHLTMEEMESGTDWVLTRLADPDDAPLRAYEKTLLDGIFATSNPVRLRELSRTFAGRLERVQEHIRLEVRDQGWFRHGPDQKSPWGRLGFHLILWPLVLSFLTLPASIDLDAAGGIHRGIPSGVACTAGLVLAGVIIYRWGKILSARTAKGSAVLTQLYGFRRYLATAEADQIRFEEAQDIFNRYLPYAMVFGVAEHWVSILKDVMRRAGEQGIEIRAPSWYALSAGAAGGSGGLDHLLSGTENFTSTAVSVFAMPSSGITSDGSGFGGGFGGPGGGSVGTGGGGFSGGSSGGGFSGGGGGGGGSGSW